jgi:hypothetical protein
MRDQEHWHNYNSRSKLSLACMMRAVQLSSDSNFHTKVVMEIWDEWFLGSQLEGDPSPHTIVLRLFVRHNLLIFSSCKRQSSWYWRKLISFAFGSYVSLLYYDANSILWSAQLQANRMRFMEPNPLRSFFCIETKYPPSLPTSGQLAICSGQLAIC